MRRSGDYVDSGEGWARPAGRGKAFVWLIRLPLTCAADLYGLGVLCYQSLTGRVPFAGDARAQLLAKFGQKPHPPSVWERGVAADLESMVLALLATRADPRPTARELLALLRRGPPSHAAGRGAEAAATGMNR
jgi:serine/threonine protein kinase